jgi:hypothetical protein
VVTNVERLSLTGGGEHSVVTFRPTVTQAAARGAWLGGRVGAGAGLLILLAAVATTGLGVPALPGWLVQLGGPAPVSAAVAGGLSALGFIGGAVVGAVAGREAGVCVDDDGIRPRRARHESISVAGPGSRPVAHWPHVTDLRMQRYARHTQVVVYLDTGEAIRLAAPYHGRLLESDRQFERKYVMLRHLWETHRTAPGAVPVEARADPVEPAAGVAVMPGGSVEAGGCAAAGVARSAGRLG